MKLNIKDIAKTAVLLGLAIFFSYLILLTAIGGREGMTDEPEPVIGNDASGAVPELNNDASDNKIVKNIDVSGSLVKNE